MATTSVHEVRVGAKAALPTECRWCGQPLLNRTAVEHLLRVEAAHEKRIAEEVAGKAAAIAAARIQEVREAAAEKTKEWREKYEALQKEHKQELAKQRVQVEKDAEEKAERKVSTRIRSLEQTAQTALAEKEAMQRRLEHLTAAERGAFSEDDLVHELKQAFGDDRIDKRGRSGDVLHQVFYRAGAEQVKAGLIVYEVKDTLHWNKDFITQAREAAETHRTPYAVVVTKAFPPKHKDLAVRDEVIVVHPSRAVDLVRVLRRMIVEVHRAGLSAQGQAEKTMALHRYLTSEEFRQTFDGVVELGRRLKNLLEEERKGHQRTWDKRRDAYEELGDKMTAIDQRIRNIIERPAADRRTKVVKFPAS